MIVAVVPARGGSKRIKNKNVRPFAGKPLISYSLTTAQKSAIFDDIIVSTDSNDIAEVAREYGATCIIKRSPTLSDDYTGTTPVVLSLIHI